VSLSIPLPDRGNSLDITCSLKIFTKLTPSQKRQVIISLKDQGEVVGMLGDSINDYIALRFAAFIIDYIITGHLTFGNT
jgi:soluble P-type ATPase